MYVYVAFMCVSCVSVCVTIYQLTGSRKSLLDAAVSSIVQHQCLQNGGSTPGRTGMTHEGSSCFCFRLFDCFVVLVCGHVPHMATQ